MKRLYSGMDLHSSNTYIGILDQERRRIFKKRVPNDLERILQSIEPFRKHLSGIAIESTFNWYWLVDGLMDAGYKVHLANPAKMEIYKGMKHQDDKVSAFWLAELLVLNILPEGYIYPKEDRPVRDLTRKRGYFVKQRTSNKLSFQSLIERNTGEHLSCRELDSLHISDIKTLLKHDFLVSAALAHYQTILHYNHIIDQIEKKIFAVAKLREPFHLLLTITGVGKILAITIMYEVGDIRRFAQVGDFSSYCRCVPSRKSSNEKFKGEANKRNGNKYLSWAFAEAAHFAVIHSARAKKYYDRKKSQTNLMVAARALANKLSRATFYMLRDKKPFREDALYC